MTTETAARHGADATAELVRTLHRQGLDEEAICDILDLLSPTVSITSPETIRKREATEKARPRFESGASLEKVESELGDILSRRTLYRLKPDS